MNYLRNFAGLLNQAAPEGEFLAYINNDEAEMLKDAGGAGLLTPQGIPSYRGDAAARSTGAAQSGRADPGDRGDPGEGSDSDGNFAPTRNEPAFTSPSRFESVDPQLVASSQQEGGTTPNTLMDNIKDYIAGGGIIGMGLRALEPFSKQLQQKAMDFSLNNKINKLVNKSGSTVRENNIIYRDELTDLRKDLDGVRDGTFTQNDFTEKYGSGDLSDLNDRDKQDLEQSFQAELPFAIGGTTSQPSMVNQYFANFNNQNLGISSAYLDTYNAAKDRMAKSLNLQNNTQQFGFNANPFQNISNTMTTANPFFDELTNQGII
ncbi:MAG: hypothetical protein CBB97_05135 [Candidatus Endolissoclinum sp. TMED37]|nr:MAG: hypothetical protein CBB97_05135 [Candidatus Endolissoclinum sp. TMED37]